MYVITVDINSTVSAKQLARLVRIHEAPYNPCVIVYSEEELPNGFTVTSFDGMVEDFTKANPKYADEKSVKKALHDQKKKLKKDKHFNK